MAGRKGRKTLRCKCGAVADLRDNPGAWDGWQVVPNDECPDCIRKKMAARVVITESRSGVQVMRTMEVLS